MAKKDKDTLYKEYLAELIAIKPELKDLLEDEKVSTKLREGVLARADYSQSMDALKAEKEQVSTYLQQEKQKIEGWYKWYGDATAQMSATAEELQKYKDEFGDLDDKGQRRAAAQMGMTPDQVNKILADEIQKRETAYLKFAEDLTDIKMDHRDRFKERLDTEAVYKLAADKQLSLQAAYKEYISERVDDLNRKDLEDRLKAAREEGFKEALSKHNLPVMSSDPTVTHVLDVQDAPKTQSERVAAALAAFGKR